MRDKIDFKKMELECNKYNDKVQSFKTEKGGSE